VTPTDTDRVALRSGEICVSGFRRPDGRVGVRNRALVLPSVICSHQVADRIAAEVDSAVSAPHDHGCAQIGADNDQTERTFIGVARNPNVSGTVVVGLGCEAIQSGDVAAELDRRGAPVREVAIQNAGGTDECIADGVSAVRDLLDADGGAERESADLSDLTVGVVSSDLAPSTVETAEPVVGEFVRELTDAGGRVVVAGVERIADTPVSEFASDEAVDAVEGLLAAHRDRPARATRVRRQAADRDPAELARVFGGVPVTEAVSYGDSVSQTDGLAVIDAPSQFAEAATGLAAAGAQLVVHVTADGIATGHPVVPVVTMTGDPATAAALSEDIDFDATAGTGAELLRRVAAVADGVPSSTERHGLTEFAITRIGPSM
jgi:altronate dehydratase large subunit